MGEKPKFNAGDYVLILDSYRRPFTVGMVGVVIETMLPPDHDLTKVDVPNFGKWGYKTNCLKLVEKGLPDERAYLAGLSEISEQAND